MKVLKALVFVLVCSLEAAPVFSMDSMNYVVKLIGSVHKCNCKCYGLFCCCGCDADEDDGEAALYNRGIELQTRTAHDVSTSSSSDPVDIMIANSTRALGEKVGKTLIAYRNEHEKSLKDIYREQGLEAVQEAHAVAIAEYYSEYLKSRSNLAMG